MTDAAYTADGVTVYHGDCLDVLAELADASVDAVITDPPYALGFMGKEWDRIGDTGRGGRARVERAAQVTPAGRAHDTSAGPYLAGGVDSLRSAGQPFQQWCQAWAAECLRVLKPGGHLAAFGGTRTYHRLTCGLEDAGFEIRDCLAWLYGSGFPKSLDVSKAIDKAAGAERGVGEPGRYATRRPRAEVEAVNAYHDGVGNASSALITTPATPEAQAWDGWGTALKPAHEPIVLARKPLAGTVAGNVLEHGTGALNIDACRVAHGNDVDLNTMQRQQRTSGSGWDGYQSGIVGKEIATYKEGGRWPANVVLDDEAAAMLDAQSGDRPAGGAKSGASEHAAAYSGALYGAAARNGVAWDGFGDSGGASRFLYTAKASKADRGHGNTHPTVKPVDLMRWLIRLVTPPGGLVLDPFAGSGTTAVACLIEGFPAVLAEREADYINLIIDRLTTPIQPVLL